MECHCLLLLDKQHQTQTGLCESDTIVELFSLLASRPVAGQHCGHTLQAQTLDSQGCEGFCCHKKHCVFLEGKGFKAQAEKVSDLRGTA